MTLPDRRRINLYCTGSGGPTVFLDGGWTSTTASWRKVQPELARTMRVCSYDRAGYGFSDSGPMPRTAAALERDFDAVVTASGEKGPFIVVAHSLGSFPARLYATRHSQTVAALILLDQPVEHTQAEYEAIRPEAGDAGFVTAAVACSEAVIAGAKPIPSTDVCLDAPSLSIPASLNAARDRFEHSAAYQRTAMSEIQAFLTTSGDEMAASRRGILNNTVDPRSAAVASLRYLYRDRSAYSNALEYDLRPEDERRVSGRGYVVDCLFSAREALKADTYEGVVKAAVALGHDTDTTACVAGGLAGIRDGITAIPKPWLRGLRGQTEVAPLLQGLLAARAG